MYAADEFTWSVGWQVSVVFFLFISRFLSCLDHRVVSLASFLCIFESNPSHLNICNFVSLIQYNNMSLGTENTVMK